MCFSATAGQARYMPFRRSVRARAFAPLSLGLKNSRSRHSTKALEPTLNSAAIDVITTFWTFHSIVFSLKGRVFQTVLVEPSRSSKNHILIFRNPRKIRLDDLRRRVIVLDIISEESSKRRHSSDKQSFPKRHRKKGKDAGDVSIAVRNPRNMSSAR